MALIYTKQYHRLILCVDLQEGCMYKRVIYVGYLFIYLLIHSFHHVCFVQQLNLTETDRQEGGSIFKTQLKRMEERFNVSISFHSPSSVFVYMRMQCNTVFKILLKNSAWNYHY